MTRQPLRIALHNGARVWGGAEQIQAALLAGLVRRGHEAVYYCNSEAVADRAATYGLDCRIEHLGGDVAIHDAIRFGRRLRRLEPDVLIGGTYRKLWLAGLASRIGRVRRLVARIEISGDIARNAKYRFVFEHFVDAIVCVSREIRDLYLEAGYAPNKVVTIYNGVELEEPSEPPEAVRRSLGIPRGASVIGGIGRLVGQKRFDRLLRAFARLQETSHCLIAGEGADRRALESLAVDLGIADRVHFLGFRSDIPDLLAAIDVLVISSDTEGFSLVMAEALAAGVPVVSTPVAGPSEVLRDPTYDPPPGRLVGFDEGEIAAAVEKLASNPARRAAMSRSGKRMAAERFSVDRMLDRWEEVLYRLSAT